MLVYRYVDVNKFKDMIESKTLLFVNPFTKWEDKKEGFLHRFCRNESVRMKMATEVRNGVDNEILRLLQTGKVHKEEIVEERIDWFGMRCQSWSKAYDSEKMWKEYSDDNNESVCVAVDTANLLSLHYGSKKLREWM